MPRSQNRRTIEVPVALCEELKARAQQEGTTIPAVLRGPIVDGESMQARFGQIDGQSCIAFVGKCGSCERSCCL